jgi:hypothetical protein
VNRPPYLFGVFFATLRASCEPHLTLNALRRHVSPCRYYRLVKGSLIVAQLLFAILPSHLLLDTRVVGDNVDQVPDPTRLASTCSCANLRSTSISELEGKPLQPLTLGTRTSQGRYRYLFSDTKGEPVPCRAPTLPEWLHA